MSKTFQIEVNDFVVEVDVRIQDLDHADFFMVT